MEDDVRLRVALLVAYYLSHPPLCWVHRFKTSLQLIPAWHGQHWEALGAAKARPPDHRVCDATRPMHVFTRPKVVHRYFEILVLPMQYFNFRDGYMT